MKFIRKTNKTKLLSIIALVLSIIGISLGFAAFSTALKISSNATVTPDSSTFGVKFSTNKDSLAETAVVPSSKSDGITTTDGVINNSGNPMLSGLSAVFSKPGQYAEYMFYARNEGEYTAYLNNINFIGDKVCKVKNNTSDSLVEAACNSIKISATIGENTYNTTTGITGHSLASGYGEKIVVRIEYVSDGVFVDGDFSITFPNIAFVYSTIDDSSIKPVIPESKIVRLESGSLDTPGSIVSIGNEKFYVIGQENDNVKLFSMYNLHVGNRVEGMDDSGKYIVTPLENPTGIQDSLAKGYIVDESGNENFPFIGTTVFSTVSGYSGSVIESYVNNYRNYLERLGTNISNARLIIRSELETFGCSGSSNCKSAPGWIWSSAYWTGMDTAGSGLPPSGSIWFVNTNGAYGKQDGKTNNYRFGVRPVIEIPLSEFE